MTENIGALLVKLLFDDSQFERQTKKATGQFAKTGDGFVDIAKKMNAGISAAFVAGSAAITGFVTASAVIGAGFERQIDVVGAISRATTGELETLEARARELGASTSFTATQAGEALGVLAQAGKSVQDSLAISGDALAFARAQTADLAAATELLVSTTNTFPDVAGDSARASDILTTATQKTQLNFERLGNSLTFAGPQAAAFRISLEETTAALGAFADIGLPASVAGTTFRQALVQAALATEDQQRVLGDLGLTVEDINPETQKFTGIIENLAATSITAAQSTAIFGTRAGGAIKTLIDATREGRVNIRQLTSEIQDSTGSTADTVERLSDNVATQATIVRSTVEDVFLSTFEAINEPLQATLEALQPFFNTVSEAIAATSDRIEQTLLPAVTRFAAALGEAGPEAANVFAGALTLAADAAAALLNFATLLLQVFEAMAEAVDALGFGGVVRDLTALAGIMSAVGTAATVLTAGLGSLAAGTGAAAAGAGGLLAVLTGPVGLLAALGLVTVGFIEYSIAAREGEEATRALADAQSLVAGRAASLQAELQRNTGTEDLVRATTEFVAAQQAAIDAGEDLNAVLREETGTLQALIDAANEAGSFAAVEDAIASGDIIAVGDQLRTVAGIVDSLDADGFEALDASARSFREESERIAETLVGVRERFEEARASQEAGGERFGQAFEFGTEQATLEFISQQEARQEAATKAAQNIERTRNRAEDQALGRARSAQEQATVDAAREANKRAAIAEREAGARVKAAARAASDIASMLEGAQAAGRGLFLAPPEQVAADLQLQIQAVDDALAEFLDKFSGAQEARQAVVEQAEAARLALRANTARQLQLLDEQAAAVGIDLAQQRAAAVGRFTASELSRSEQIRADGEEAITGILRAAEEERAAIRAQFSARAEGAADAGFRVALRKQEAAELASLERRLGADVVAIRKAAREEAAAAEEEATARQLQQQQRQLDTFVDQVLRQPGPIARAFGSLSRSIVEDLGQIAPALAVGVTDALKVISAAASQVQVALGGIQGFATQILGGFGLDAQAILGVVGELGGAVADARADVADAEAALQDAQSAGDAQAVARAQERLAAAERALAAREGADASGEAARSQVDNLFDNAIGFAQSFAANIGAVLEQFADRLPELVQALVEAIPQILQAVADSLPKIVQALADGIVPVVQAVVDNIGPVITSLLDALPGLVAELADAIVLLIEAVPDIVARILAGLPDIITALLSGTTLIVEAVVDAVPLIVAALIEGIPDILAALIGGLPELILAVVDGVLELVPKLIDAVPQLVGAVISALPILITEILALLPQIVTSLAEQMPQITAALIASGPQILVEILAALPEIAIALVDGVFVELLPRLPDIAVGVVAGVIAAFEDAVSDFAALFRRIFEEALGFIGDIFGGGEGGGLLARVGGGLGDAARALGGAARDITGAIGGLFGGGAQGGIPFVQRNGGVLLERGEAVLTSAQNRERLLGRVPTGRLNRATGAGGITEGQAAGGGFGGTLVVQIGDREFDRFTVESDGRGSRNLTNKSNRRKTGTRVGYKRRD